uniref:Uncharacterized protein n=1 Tax=Avena sativa TaxID=4498 RepID=A0ACD5XHH7_AVESA
MVVCYRRTLGQSGPVLQRPVILPPLEAGSERCSVKPASRSACHFRDREANAFASAPRPTTQLGTGKPAYYSTGPGPKSNPNIHTTLMPPHGLQARATELGVHSPSAEYLSWWFSS